VAEFSQSNEDNGVARNQDDFMGNISEDRYDQEILKNILDDPDQEIEHEIRLHPFSC
jgi:hypothetical protein